MTMQPPKIAKPIPPMPADEPKPMPGKPRPTMPHVDRGHTNVKNPAKHADKLRHC